MEKHSPQKKQAITNEEYFLPFPDRLLSVSLDYPTVLNTPLHQILAHTPSLLLPLPPRAPAFQKDPSSSPFVQGWTSREAARCISRSRSQQESCGIGKTNILFWCQLLGCSD